MSFSWEQWNKTVDEKWLALSQAVVAGTNLAAINDYLHLGVHDFVNKTWSGSGLSSSESLWLELSAYATRTPFIMASSALTKLHPTARELYLEIFSKQLDDMNVGEENDIATTLESASLAASAKSHLDAPNTASSFLPHHLARFGFTSSPFQMPAPPEEVKQPFNPPEPPAP